MKKLIVACTALCALGLSGAANAEVTVQRIVVNQVAQTPAGTNVRVDMFNTGIYGEKLTQVQLQGRTSNSDSWTTLKTWDRTVHLDGHKRLTLDFFPLATGTLDPILTQNQFQLRAVISTPSGQVISDITTQAAEAATR